MHQGPPQGPPPYYGPPQQQQNPYYGYGPQQPSPYGYGQPPPQKDGPNILYWVLGLLGVGFVLLVGLIFAIGVLKGYKDAKNASTAPPASTIGGHGVGHGGGHGRPPGLGTTNDDDDDEETDDDDDDDEPGIVGGGGSHLPAVPPRAIPHHDVKMLQGCSDADLTIVMKRIDDAVATGAPRYNRGDFQGCYDLYVSTSTELEGDLSKTCKGPVSALKSGRDKAAKLSTVSDKAWAMRDSFDGLLDVIDRKGPSL